MLLMEISEEFSKNLEYYRKLKGLSQRELATQTGISNRMIAHYEKNPGAVPFKNLQILAKALDITIGDFFASIPGRNTTEKIDIRWIKKIKEIQQLPDADIKEINHHINSSIKKAKLMAQMKS